jgi:hypothetical protein
VPGGFSLGKERKQPKPFNGRQNLIELTLTGSTVGEWVKSESPSMWPNPDSSKAVPKARENSIKMGERKRPKF